VRPSEPQADRLAAALISDLRASSPSLASRVDPLPSSSPFAIHGRCRRRARRRPPHARRRLRDGNRRLHRLVRPCQNPRRSPVGKRGGGAVVSTGMQGRLAPSVSGSEPAEPTDESESERCHQGGHQGSSGVIRQSLPMSPNRRRRRRRRDCARHQRDPRHCAPRPSSHCHRRRHSRHCCFRRRRPLASSCAPCRCPIVP